MKKILATIMAIVMALSVCSTNLLCGTVSAEAIVENPIQEIEIEDITIIEGTNGSYSDGVYEYHTPTLSGVVTFKDGTTEEFWGSRITIDDVWYGVYAEDWYSKPLIVGKTYEFTVSLMGVSDTFNVTIVESPIDKIEINDVTIIEGTNGSYSDGVYEYDTPTLSGVVTFKDGTTQEFQYYIDIDDVWYWVSIDNWYSQQYEQPLTVGNTYEFTGTLMGVSDTFNVTIVESPIEEIEIEDITIIEGTNASYSDGNYEYYTPTLSGVVTFKDGTIQEFRDSIPIDDVWYHLSVNNWYVQQYEQPLTVGNTYEFTGSLKGVRYTFNVTIVESPIEEIEIEDITILEGTNGSYSDGVYVYGTPTLSGVVTFKDGTTEEFYSGVRINGEWYGASVNNWYGQQYEQPFVAGNTYELTGTLLGVSDIFNVTIVESPIEEIVVEDIILFEGIDSYNDGEYEKYDVFPILSEVTFKDGSKAEIDGRAIKYNGEYYYIDDNSWDMQQTEPWVGGNTYEVTVALLGITTTIKVTVAEYPIEELEIVALPEKTEYLVGEYFNLKGTTIKIKYKDGSSENVAIEKDYLYTLSSNLFSDKLQVIYDLYTSCAYGSFGIAGAQTVEIQLLGKTCEIPVVVKENLTQSISIKENTDKTISITVNNSDNTSYDMTLLDVLDLPACWDDEEVLYVPIVTDKGVFDAVIFDNDEYFSIGFDNGDAIIESNHIAVSEWFQVIRRVCGNWPLFYDYYGGDGYTGVITTKNIDDIIRVAIMLEELWHDAETIDETIDGNWYSFTGSSIREAVMKNFALDNLDLTLSEYYDPATDTYIDYEDYGWGSIGEVLPNKTVYRSGEWFVEITVQSPGEYTVNTLTFKVDDEHRFVSCIVNGVGNVDGIEGIADADAEYLLMHTFFSEEYPVNQDCDFNGDGFVTDADAEHLLMYTFFPDDYPLN